VPKDYVYDQGFAEERARLAGIESLWDPGSQALLNELGIGAGWRCLEVGAGGGSLVQWMANRGATVVAIDIDTRFIEPLASDAVEVRCLDIRTGELPHDEFDLVHARLVLEHLTERRKILARWPLHCARAAGWLSRTTTGRGSASTTSIRSSSGRPRRSSRSCSRLASSRAMAAASSLTWPPPGCPIFAARAVPG
jgi:2-polyprenyl-3-methyl-5-hydroxy-6-metoxy-1,4-benzoquinol methylase